MDNEYRLFLTKKYYEDELMAKYGDHPFTPNVVELMKIHLEQLHRYKTKTETSANWQMKPNLYVDPYKMLIAVDLINE